MRTIVKILVVDDETSIRELVKYNLEKAGYSAECVADGLSAMKKIETDPPDLVMLDLMLPGMDGLEICRNIRQTEKIRLLPVIMLTARDEEIDRVVGLEIGADDYLTKPFSPRELVARVKALLRRTKDAAKPVMPTGLASGPDEKSIVRGELEVFPDRYETTLAGESLNLTPKEFQLLVCLAGAPGKVFTRDYLLETIWGYDFAGDTRTIDVHIRHLRQQLEKGSGREVIETVRGIGYRFKI